MREMSASSAARVLARPMTLHRGQALERQALVAQLEALGYTHRPRAADPGELTVEPQSVLLNPRGGDLAGRLIRVAFAGRGGAGQASIDRIEVIGDGVREGVSLERPLISSLSNGDRQKQRKVPLSTIPRVMVEALLAIEDRRFYAHPGVDAIRTVGALVTNILGTRPYLEGGSTLTQQLVKNVFLSPDKTIRRKLLEQGIALILERRLTKDEILELYLNEVYLGQRGSFAIRGVDQAARLFFGKSIGNVGLAEAATIAGVIQSPTTYSPFRAPERAQARRDVVLHAMSQAGFITGDQALTASREPLRVVPRALDAEAPHFVDLVADLVNRTYPGLTRATLPVTVHTTLDLRLQREAQAAVSQGLAAIDQSRGDTDAEAALIALDPRNGDVLALVGGRSYPESQFNRATRARRQPGSVFKPFVYLAAFEHAAAEGRRDMTTTTLVIDEPTTFTHGTRTWRPSNYGDRYDGPITLRRALALSRNVAAVKVARQAGYERVAQLWSRIGAGTAPQPYPSIALGVFEATPMEIASAFTLFPNQGIVQPLRLVEVITHGESRLSPPEGAARRVARPETTYLVTDMMRSVLDSGTGIGARAAGFRRVAAGKSGTTNDLRDAWFVGFTPELLTVVWVGRDDNRSLGSSGTQAALPIWTAFMQRALAGRPDQPFARPDGVRVLLIDRSTGQLAGPRCPIDLRFREAFVLGTEPTSRCHLHPN